MRITDLRVYKSYGDIGWVVLVLENGDMFPIKIGAECTVVAGTRGTKGLMIHGCLESPTCSLPLITGHVGTGRKMEELCPICCGKGTRWLVRETNWVKCETCDGRGVVPAARAVKGGGQ